MTHSFQQCFLGDGGKPRCYWFHIAIIKNSTPEHTNAKSNFIVRGGGSAGGGGAVRLKYDGGPEHTVSKPAA